MELTLLIRDGAGLESLHGAVGQRLAAAARAQLVVGQHRVGIASLPQRMMSLLLYLLPLIHRFALFGLSTHCLSERHDISL